MYFTLLVTHSKFIISIDMAASVKKAAQTRLLSGGVSPLSMHVHSVESVAMGNSEKVRLRDPTHLVGNAISYTVTVRYFRPKWWSQPLEASSKKC